MVVLAVRMAPMQGLVLSALALTLALAAPTVDNTTEVVSNGIDAVNKSDDAVAVTAAQSAVLRGCAARYTMTCLKLDALSVLGRMAVPASYDLLPGVTIHRQQASAGHGLGLDLPGDLVRSLASDGTPQVDRQLDDFLMTRFGSFLDSHTVQVHLLDLQPVASLRRALGAQGEGDATGRRKNGMWQQLMGAGMMMGGSTLTMGLSALAAMAGKALMLSMLSLVLSALSGMNGGGGGGGGGGHSQKQTTYEIISKPIYTHGHSHSAELHHEPSGPAGYGLYGRAKDGAEGGLAGTGASGVGGSAIGAQGSTYITQFPRSLQESAQISHHTKKEDDKASLSSAAASAVGAANYDSLLIRNLQYVKGPDGRAKYAVASDLVPSETDYGGNGADEVAASSGGTARKYAGHGGHDDPSARSFQLSPEEEEDEEDGRAGVAGLGGVYEAGGGVLAGPRSMHTLARLPQLLVARPRHDASQQTPPPPALSSSSFPEPLPADMIPLSSMGSSWEAITAAPPPTSTGRVNPAFVVAKAVVPATRIGEDFPSAAPQPPRTVAYRAYS